MGALIWLSAAGWVALLLSDNAVLLPRICSAEGWNVAAQALAAARFNPLGELLLAYAAMLAAMMLPLLALPIRELSDRSVPQARVPAAIVYVSGYAAIWLAAAPVFGLAVVSLASGFATGSAWTPVLPSALAFVWHMVPARQLALNRCHRRLTLFVTSRSNLPAAVAEGARQGLTCLASCAPLMLWAMTRDGWHMPAMALVALFVWAERQMPPERPLWGPVNWLRTGERLQYFFSHCIRRAKAAQALEPAHG